MPAAAISEEAKSILTAAGESVEKEVRWKLQGSTLRAWSALSQQDGSLVEVVHVTLELPVVPAWLSSHKVIVTSGPSFQQALAGLSEPIVMACVAAAPFARLEGNAEAKECIKQLRALNVALVQKGAKLAKEWDDKNRWFLNATCPAGDGVVYDDDGFRLGHSGDVETGRVEEYHGDLLKV